MATTALGDDPAHTIGELPAVGDQAPSFTLVDTDLKEFSLGDLPGRKVLSIFPSIGTGVCQAALREFNKRAAAGGDVGIFHETYVVPRDGIESLYGNMPAFGLAAAHGARPRGVPAPRTAAHDRLESTEPEYVEE